MKRADRFGRSFWRLGSWIETERASLVEYTHEKEGAPYG